MQIKDRRFRMQERIPGREGTIVVWMRMKNTMKMTRKAKIILLNY